MSKLSQELQLLFLLNDRYKSNQYVSMKELKECVSDISDRQIRRYLYDLEMAGFSLDTKVGPNGGYRLINQLSSKLSIPENILMAISLATNKNEQIESALKEIDNFPSIDILDGDNYIKNDIITVLTTLYKAIKEREEICFKYRNYEKLFIVEPYRLLHENNTYYLKAVHNDIIKTFDISYIDNIKFGSNYKYSFDIDNKIKESNKIYGIINKKESMLRVKCKDGNALDTFDKYYEHKGKKLDDFVYEIVSNDEHELYYQLFRISTKDYVFLDEDFKNRYLKYIYSHFRSIKNQRNN